MRLLTAGPRPSEVRLDPWRPNILVLVCSSAVLLGLGLGTLLVAIFGGGYLGPYRYSLTKWEADHVLDTAFRLVGIGPDPNDADGLESLRHYFSLTSQIRTATNQANPDLTQIDNLTGQRAEYENQVERLIERYIGEAVSGAGLEHSLPFFHGVGFVWPPVAFELTTPPKLLVRSPRDQIRRDGDTLLRSGLSLRDVDQIEAHEDSSNEVSLVVDIGGLAAYPAIVRDDRSYDALLDSTSHEWTHHYLAFFPLGEQWGKGGNAETLNETTANIAGREIANLIRKAHPVKLGPAQDGNGPAGAAPTVDFNKEMRALRLQVDALLKDGKVAEAEKAMEDRRIFLADHGIVIRKINQAYFAFYGTYGDSAASSNPVGPKIEEVWSLTKDVGLFLRVMREVTNVQDLDASLAALRAGHLPH
jgi:hypothetical protein